MAKRLTALVGFNFAGVWLKPGDEFNCANDRDATVLKLIKKAADAKPAKAAAAPAPAPAPAPAEQPQQPQPRARAGSPPKDKGLEYMTRDMSAEATPAAPAALVTKAPRDKAGS